MDDEDDDTEPALVLVRTPCPWCEAATKEEAEKNCKGIFCPASDLDDADGYIVAPTPESAEAWRLWDEAQG